jgi:hypothetical protein
MRTHKALLLPALVLAAAFSFSCGDNSTSPTPPNTARFLNLSQKANVLHNFELAHNKRNPNEYAGLLDDNFTFFYTEGDPGGAATPVQWGRADDIAVTTSLFASADKLNFDLSDPNGVAWIETPASGGTETWYTATMYYTFTVKLNDTTYIPPAGSKMALTVRNAGTVAKPQWMLIELRDLGAFSQLNQSVVSEGCRECDATSYGTVKAKFRK